MPLTSMPKNIKVKQTHRRTVPVIFILVFLVNSLCTLWLAHLLYLTTPSSTDADNREKKTMPCYILWCTFIMPYMTGN